VTAEKREGDLKTPLGDMALVRVYYRSDRVTTPVTTLPVDALKPEDGWCDDPSHADYNTKVSLPHPARCEHLWREDSVYDIVVVLNWNLDPIVKGRGSAIFLHLARPDYEGTEGCVAISLKDMLALLKDAALGDVLTVKA